MKPISKKIKYILFQGVITLILMILSIHLSFSVFSIHVFNDTLTQSKSLSRELDGQTKNIQRAVMVLAKNPLFQKYSSTDRKDLYYLKTKAVLNSIKSLYNASIVYILNEDGKAIISTTYENNKNLEGKNFSFRPYFREAKKGNPYIYTAVGTITGKGGIYFSHPIKYSGGKINVAVIKFPLKIIETNLYKSKIKFFLIAQNNIIFSTYNKKWLYHSTKALSKSTLSTINKSKQFNSIKIKTLPFNLLKKKININGKNYITSQISLHIPGWKLITLKNYSYKYPILMSLLSSFFLFILSCLIFLYCQNMKRRKILKEKQIHTLHLLKESEENYKRVFENTGTATGLIGPEGYILMCNSQFIRISGYTNDEIINKLKWTDFTHPDDLERMTRYNEARKNNQDAPTEYEMMFINRSKKIYNMIVKVEMMPGTKTSITSLNNITLLKKAQDELITARNISEEAAGLKSTFLANMTHEIRTPLNSLIGYTDLLLNEEDPEKQKQYQQIIHESSSFMLTLINDVLDFSKIEAGELAIDYIPYSLRKILSTIKLNGDLLLSHKKSHVELSINCDEKIEDLIITDPIRIQQVLNNLISNAVKFTDEGTINLSVDIQNETLQFTIADTGIGIPIHKQKEIFKAYLQGDSSISRHYGGTGLGLSISKNIIELMNGSISVFSNGKNKGSIFKFSIPYHPSIDAEEFEKVSSPKLSSKKDLKILLVEDNNVNRKMISTMLNKNGIDVSEAADGYGALKILQYNKNFDLIFVDLYMPGIDGIETLEEMKKLNLPPIPKIMFTASTDNEDKKRCFNAGFTDYLTKPVTLKSLLDIIEKHLN